MSDMTSAVAIDLIDNLIGMIEDNQENDYDAAFRMAIESLKAQAERTEERTETHGVCLDAIDRQVAIDTLHDEIVRRRINEDSIDDGALDEFDTEAILRRLPPAQPEPHWIPCNERLPDKPNVYTVTDHDGRVVRYVYNDNESSREYWKRCAKAWMPLPEPYAERRTDGIR